LGIAIELIEKLVDIYNTEKQLQTKVQKAAASETRHKAMKAGLLQSDDPVGLIVVSSMLLFLNDLLSR
jgi:hypothetical protein